MRKRKRAADCDRLQGDIKSEMEGTVLKCEEFGLDEALSVVIECYHEL